MSKFLVVLEFIVLETFFSHLFFTLDFFVRNLELVAAPVKLNASRPRITQSQLGERVPGHNINLSLILMKTIWGKILENLNLKPSETFFNLKIPTMYWGTWNSLVAEFHHPSSYLLSFLEGNILLRRKAAKKLISTLGKVEFARKN